ncbi:MAG: efflux RND transporter permease subunit, partial [Burkholderiales bacterium]
GAAMALPVAQQVILKMLPFDNKSELQVVVENIVRHWRGAPGAEPIPTAVEAVAEVGNPTIVATLTVIAALLPMAFVTGLMGPYMSPIPINASMGMLISLAIAFMVTPWLANRWLGRHVQHGPSRLQRGLERGFGAVFRPFLDARHGGWRRLTLGLAILLLIGAAMALPVAQQVILKMLPFDNKSELQVVVDMPAGTPPERTAAVLRELGAHLARVPEVRHYQAYVGLGSPINFNGLVRQYDMRSGGEVGDIQVTLAPKEERDAQSHAIATRVRPELQAIGERHGARIKVVEVPPGPPVLAPLVAEVYGPSADGRQRLARQVEEVFRQTDGVVDVDTSLVADAPRALIQVDRRKAALAGVPQQSIVSTLNAALAGIDATYLHDASKYPAPVYLRLPVADRGDLEAALALGVRNAEGDLIPIRELVSVETSRRDQILYRKDLLPVTYVVGDMAGAIDSPLYAMFAMRGALAELIAPDGNPLGEQFISQPSDPYRGFAVKWDGEWQITYETFRDMGIAYAVGLVMIYLLVVAQFGSYLVPLIIMAPIPLTIIGVMPGHALLGAPFTATSMIGMIALAGIIVRNSILLVDFIELQLAEGVAFRDAVVRSAVTRAQPIALTAVAAMAGAFFILDDPIFNGLAISLIFGILVSTLLTLVVIPLIFFAVYRRRHEPRDPSEGGPDVPRPVSPEAAGQP